MGSERNPARVMALRDLYLFLETDSDNDEFDDFSRMPNIMKSDSNVSLGSSNRKKKLKHVSAQTTFDSYGILYCNWLLDSERKLEAFCVKLSNLLKILHQAQNTLSITKRNELSSNASAVRSNYVGKSFQPIDNSCSSAMLPANRSNNQKDDFPFEFVRDKISSILNGTKELKKEILKFVSEKQDYAYEEKEEIVKYTSVKESTTLKIERSKPSLCKTGSLPLKSYKTKPGNTHKTITKSKSVAKMQIYEKSENLNKMAFRNSEMNTHSFSKTKAVSNVKNTASRMNTQAKLLQTKAPEVPTKDTGAIPKTRVERRVTSSNPTTRKQTKSTIEKPLWR